MCTHLLTRTHTTQWIQHNNPGGNGPLHWTASTRHASKNNGCDNVMWLGAFLKYKSHTHTHTHTHILPLWTLVVRVAHYGGVGE